MAEDNMLQIGIAAASILIPLAVKAIQDGTAPDGTPLTQQEIDELRTFVDQHHAIVQKLPEGNS